MQQCTAQQHRTANSFEDNQSICSACFLAQMKLWTNVNEMTGFL